MLNTNLPLMKRNIYQPAFGCSCGLHTWPTLLQSFCKILYRPENTEALSGRYHIISSASMVNNCFII